MRDSNDKMTMNIEGLPGVPGRPATGQAKTTAQRQKDYRNRREIAKVRRNNDLVEMFEGRTTEDIAFELTIKSDNPITDQHNRDAWEEIGKRMGWL